MENLSNYLKSKEFLFSLIYIPLYISLAFIGGEIEIVSAIVSGILTLLLLVLLIRLSINFRSYDKKIKFRSFTRFLISNIILLIVIAIISLIIVQNCSGGLCGLTEAETFLLFISLQILSLFVYGISLIVVNFLYRKIKE